MGPAEAVMPRPIHFEIHAEDPVRAQSFYSQLFGWDTEGNILGLMTSDPAAS
jgi:predicted enzyme related to lactoylglutathione lyase